VYKGQSVSCKVKIHFHNSAWGFVADDVKDLVNQPTVRNLTQFGTNSECLSIFIDECWPEETSSGTLAGVVWDGRDIDTTILPQIRTHLRIDLKAGGTKAHTALQ